MRRAVDEERRRRLETKVRRLDIAKLIYNSVYSTETTERDLTAADELVRGLTFDKYEENAVSQVFIGIKTSDFDQLVNRLKKDIPFHPTRRMEFLMENLPTKTL